MLRHDAQPPMMVAPGIAYMARGGSHFENASGNILMEHEQSPHAAGSRRVSEPPHWMVIWLYDPTATGFSTRANAAGTYVMFAGPPCPPDGLSGSESHERACHPLEADQLSSSMSRRRL